MAFTVYASDYEALTGQPAPVDSGNAPEAGETAPEAAAQGRHAATTPADDSSPAAGS